jgi:RNA recognition motif-containing protein
LHSDKFLQAELAKDKNGWVCLQTVLSFNRLKALTTDLSTVLKALEKSDLVEVNETGDMIRRTTKVQDSNALERTLFLSGLKKENTLEEIEKHFEELGFQGLGAIRMIRDRADRCFIGSVFVEFKDQENMTAALQKLKEIEGFTAMTKSDYFASKGDRRSKKTSEDEYNIEYSRGCLIKVEGVSASLDHHQVKDAFAELDSSVAYFQKIEEEPSSAWIRFKEPKGLEIVKLDQVIVGDSTLTNMRLATEDEEKSYYEKLSNHMKEKRKQDNLRGGRKNQKQSKMGNRQTKCNNEKKRSAQDSDEESAPKTARLEDSDDAQASEDNC